MYINREMEVGSGAVGAQFLGGAKGSNFTTMRQFSDKTNSSDPPFNVLFSQGIITANEESCDVLNEGENEEARILHYKSKDCRLDREFKSCNI